MSRASPSYWAGLLALGIFALPACGARATTPFDIQRQHAEQAYSAGDYARAAEYWEAAARVSSSARDRDEAIYRQATSLERAGRPQQADTLYEKIEASNGDRAARAAFERAELALAGSDPEHGYARLRSAFLRFPNSGLARKALTQWLAHLKAQAAPDAVLREVRALEAPLAQSELAPTLLYLRAQYEESSGELAVAYRSYELLANRFPYPLGEYWDEALFALCRLDEAAQRYTSAARHLERILAAREHSRFTGSYERPAFAEARFKLAGLWRDHLGDVNRAYDEFLRLYRDHPTNRLRDDAVFEAGRIAWRQGDRTRACNAARILVRELAESRFARCASEICPSVRSTSGGCPAYIEAGADTPRRTTAQQDMMLPDTAPP